MTTGQLAAAHAIAVQIGSQSHTVRSDDGVAVIGRDPSSTIHINDARISRAHVRLEPHPDGWQVIDTSTNGLFLDGVQRSSVLITGPTTLHLGDAQGIAIALTPADPSDSTAVLSPAAPSGITGDDDSWDDLSETDPGVARAGRAVAARRQELGFTQRGLARDKVINAGTLIAFEKGRSWPRRGTLARLEGELEWPAGHITRIRNGEQPAQSTDANAGDITRIRNGEEPAQSADATDVLTDSIAAPVVAEFVELTMHSIGALVEALPDTTDPDFTDRVTPILADLRRLEAAAANAARGTRGTPSVALALSAVRRRYNELMLRAAASPTATLGQRLYRARHRAELSVDEAANAAGVSTQALLDAESERPVAPDAAASLSTLIEQLSLS